MSNLNIHKPVYSPSADKVVTSPKELRRIYKEHGVNNALDNKNSNISRMMKDKTMVRMVRDGKASDPGLKREAATIAREQDRNRKNNWLDQKKANVERMKREYKTGG